jgi:aminopeptidase-like protein
MKLTELMQTVDPEAVGNEMYSLAAEMFAFCRSITGEGLRRTLRIVRGQVPLQMHEVPSGSQVFDWTVPKEWNIYDAYIKNEQGERLVDFRKHNLHVVSYSLPVNRRMSLAQLRPHLFTLPEQPDWIPYRTSYYKETWGFCLSHRELEKLGEGEYDVCIDSTLEPGSLTIGEFYLPGESEDEVLISCHCCHPSLANDNLSGISLAVALAKRLSKVTRRYSYRFLFLPGTIGAISWLALNEATTARIRHGLVLSCLGDSGGFTYKKSRRGNAEIDRAVVHVLNCSDEPHRVIEFFPYGYDERQYCSPGFDLAVGCLMRSQHGTFPEYHTSADNLTFIQPSSLGRSFTKLLEVVHVLEHNQFFINQKPKCEPRLGKYGLYGGMGGDRRGDFGELALLWVLNLSDGQHDLLAIAERSGIRFGEIAAAADALVMCGLLKPRDTEFGREESP